MKKKITAIDIELNETRISGVAYYRLTKEFKDFLELCNKKHGIIGFEFEEGSFNFGIILAPPHIEKEKPGVVDTYEDRPIASA